MADGGLRPQDDAGHVGRVSIWKTLLPGLNPVLKATTVSTALADDGGAECSEGSWCLQCQSQACELRLKDTVGGCGERGFESIYLVGISSPLFCSSPCPVDCPKALKAVEPGRREPATEAD